MNNNKTRLVDESATQISTRSNSEGVCLNYQSRRFKSWIAVVAGIVAVGGFGTFNLFAGEISPIQGGLRDDNRIGSLNGVADAEVEGEVQMSEAFTELIIYDEEEMRERNSNLSQIDLNSEMTGSFNAEDVEDISRDYVNREAVVEKPKHDAPVNMAMVEQKAQFPGGDAAMYKWIAENINYPAQAAEEGISGKVVVQMVIEKDGSISNVKVVRGKHPELDAEAVRVVKAMPRWSPGRNNGHAVRVTYMLPITFSVH